MVGDLSAVCKYLTIDKTAYGVLGLGAKFALSRIAADSLEGLGSIGKPRLVAAAGGVYFAWSNKSAFEGHVLFSIHLVYMKP